jgi:hypothetical protein
MKSLIVIALIVLAVSANAELRPTAKEAVSMRRLLAHKQFFESLDGLLEAKGLRIAVSNPSLPAWHLEAGLSEWAYYSQETDGSVTNYLLVGIDGKRKLYVESVTWTTFGLNKLVENRSEEMQRLLAVIHEWFQKSANKAVDPTPVNAPRKSGGSSED